MLGTEFSAVFLRFKMNFLKGLILLWGVQPVPCMQGLHFLPSFHVVFELSFQCRGQDFLLFFLKFKMEILRGYWKFSYIVWLFDCYCLFIVKSSCIFLFWF